MQTLNGWMIQDALKQAKKINIPWLQHTFNQSYSRAKWMMEQLELRGWVVRSADRCSWRVQQKKLCLRHLEPSECPALSEQLTLDCLSALEQLQQAGGNPTTITQLREAVRGDADTVEAVCVLLKLRLVFKNDNLFFSCISNEESRALTAIARKLIRMRVADRHSPEEAVRRMQTALFPASTVPETEEDEDDDGDDW